MSTDKTLPSSIFFIEIFLGCKTLLYRPHPIPSFRLLDSVSLPGEAIRSVTHQVLAPDRRRFCLFLKSRLSSSPLWPRAPLGFPSPENVQCRAVFTQYARTVVPGPHGAAQSNTLLTHGAVESPLNSSRQPSLFAGAGERAHPISPCGLDANTCAGLPPL